MDRIPELNRELLTLYDYRKRHATYRADSNLLDSHRNSGLGGKPGQKSDSNNVADFADNIHNSGSTSMRQH